MSDDHDPIPLGAGGRVNLVEALSVAQHMPAEALDRALASPGRIRDAVLAVLGRAADGETLPVRDANLLFWGVHVLGAAGEARLFGPLLRLLRRPDEAAAELLGDVVGTTLAGLLIGSFDGEAEALFAAIADRDSDELIRWTLLGALARLVQDGRVGRDVGHAFLVRFDDERLARAGDLAWAGWAEAIGLLGLRDLLPRVVAAREGARLLDDGEEPGAIDDLVAAAEAAPDDPSRFEERGLGPIHDLVGQLDEALASDEEADASEPAHNPFRHVGRNDPCPCGSGRKYKKCCLADAEA